MNIVEFVEKVCGYKLLYWQKEFLRLIDNLPEDRRLVYCLARQRWQIVEKSKLSETSTILPPGKGYRSKICILDDAADYRLIEESNKR